jgi:hypothetical protein
VKSGKKFTCGKLYGEVPHPAGRYSPAQIQGSKTYCCTGKPDRAISRRATSNARNLTMRMSMRRFTRLTNGFSKKAENHAYSVAIHFMHCNFVRIHQSLWITPAMAAGVTTKLWSLTDTVRVIDEWEVARASKLADRLVGWSAPSDGQAPALMGRPETGIGINGFEHIARIVEE